MQNFSQFIMNHWQLWVALLIILLLIFINELFNQKKRAKALSPAAAVDLINSENATVIDLRDTEAFRSGHIIHSVRATPEDFNKPAMEKYKNKPIILVCPRGLQSQTVAVKLQSQGFTEVMVLAGGLNAWTAANLPLEKGKKA